MTAHVITVPLVVVLVFSTTIQFALPSPINQHQFKTVKSTGFPPSMAHYGKPRVVHSLIFCTTLCAQDIKCKAVYFEEGSGNDHKCYLYSQQLADLNLLSSGAGTYAYFTSFDTSATPQNYPHGNISIKAYFESVETVVAVYKLNYYHRQFTLGMFFDRKRNRFPQLSTICALRLYQVRGLSATTIVSVDEVPSSFYRLRVRCLNGETKMGDATCDPSGNWVIGPNVGVACLSTKCYRVGVDKYAHYNGTISHTVNGTSCMYWDDVYHSQFPSYSNGKVQAGNYCRDPTRAARPYCLILRSFDFCNVPKCKWDL